MASIARFLHMARQVLARRTPWKAARATAVMAATSAPKRASSRAPSARSLTPSSAMRCGWLHPGGHWRSALGTCDPANRRMVLASRCLAQCRQPPPPSHCKQAFPAVATSPQVTDSSVKVSFMELYNEELTDLLSVAEDKDKRLRLLEDRSGVVVQGLEELVVKNAEGEPMYRALKVFGCNCQLPACAGAYQMLELLHPPVPSCRAEPPPCWLTSTPAPTPPLQKSTKCWTAAPASAALLRRCSTSARAAHTACSPSPST